MKEIVYILLALMSFAIGVALGVHMLLMMYDGASWWDATTIGGAAMGFLLYVHRLLDQIDD